MIVQRFFEPGLAQASYLIGCPQTGEALVIDPEQETSKYVTAAALQYLRISHVTETHIHADFVSGARQLANDEDAELLLSAEGGPDWQYGYAQSAGATLLRNGDEFRVGNVRVQVMHTPGHTPEHVSFLITDTAAADEPIAIVTGDFVFVGDVGRPDLLEKAAHVAGTMDRSARDLFRSLQKFKELPDWLQIWPGHGAGSACGKGLSAIPHSTVGYEYRFNWALQIEEEEDFVSAVLEGQPEPPKYFAEMKRINREGPPLFTESGQRGGAFGTVAQMKAALASGGTVIDARSSRDFAERHIPGTINLPGSSSSFTTYAGSVVPYDKPVYLIVPRESFGRVYTELMRIGLSERLHGAFEADIVAQWAAAGNPDAYLPQINADALASQMGTPGVTVVDVRARSEWDEGHLPGVPNIPLASLVDRLGEIPESDTIIVHCQAGTRGAVAASVLQARGFKNVVNFADGFESWESEGRAVERPAEESIAPLPGSDSY